jgi:hypothetical protein
LHGFDPYAWHALIFALIDERFATAVLFKTLFDYSSLRGAQRRNNPSIRYAAIWIASLRSQ